MAEYLLKWWKSSHNESHASPKNSLKKGGKIRTSSDKEKLAVFTIYRAWSKYLLMTKLIAKIMSKLWTLVRKNYLGSKARKARKIIKQKYKQNVIK